MRRVLSEDKHQDSLQLCCCGTGGSSSSQERELISIEIWKLLTSDDTNFTFLSALPSMARWEYWSCFLAGKILPYLLRDYVTEAVGLEILDTWGSGLILSWGDTGEWLDSAWDDDTLSCYFQTRFVQGQKKKARRKAVYSSHHCSARRMSDPCSVSETLYRSFFLPLLSKQQNFIHYSAIRDLSGFLAMELGSSYISLKLWETKLCLPKGWKGKWRKISTPTI